MKKLLLSILALLSSLASQAEVRTVRYITMTGEYAVNVFVGPQGQIKISNISKQEYENLVRLGAGQPVDSEPGFSWAYSATKPIFDVGNTKKDDCLILPNGVLIFGNKKNSDDNFIFLSEEEYAPRQTGPTQLTTSKDIPTVP